MEKVICPNCDKEVEKKSKCSACEFDFDMFTSLDQMLNAREKRKQKEEDAKKKKEAEEEAKNPKKSNFFDSLRGGK